MIANMLNLLAIFGIVATIFAAILLNPVQQQAFAQECEVKCDGLGSIASSKAKTVGPEISTGAELQKDPGSVSSTAQAVQGWMPMETRP